MRKLLWGIRKSDLDPERIKKANPDVPIVVEHYRGRMVVVDGAHRLMKAKEMGRKEIEVRFVTQKELGDAETKAKGTTKDRSDRSSDPGVMIALHLPGGVAGKLALRGVPGAESPSTFHVTLAYLGRISSLGSDPARVLAKVGSILRDVGKASRRLSGSVGGVGRFSGSASSDNKDVIYAGVDVPGLVELRHRICEGLKAAGITYSKDHGFTPHITLAYVDEKAKTPVLRIPSTPVAFSSLSLTSGDVQNSFPLSGSIDYARRSRPDMNETIGQRLRRVLYCRGDVACAPCARKAQEASKDTLSSYDSIDMPIVPGDDEADDSGLAPRRFRLTRGKGGTIRVTYARSTPVVRNAQGQTVSARSKSQSPACSQAASAWRTGSASKETYTVLAHCRAMAATKHAAKLHAVAGNHAKASHLEKVANSAFVSKKSRNARAAELHAQRNAGAAPAQASASAAVPAPASEAAPAPVSTNAPSPAASPAVGKPAAPGAAPVVKPPLPRPSIAERKARVLGKIEATREASNKASDSSHPARKQAFRNIARDTQAGYLAKAVEEGRPGYFSKLKERRERAASNAGGGSSAATPPVPPSAPVPAQAPPAASPSSSPTPRPISDQLNEIPPEIRSTVEGAARNRMEMLQKLRQARYMATITHGKGAGSVDKGELKTRRAGQGLTPENVRASRSRANEILGDFSEAAPANNVDPKAVLGHFRGQQAADLKGRPQSLIRGAGYYPSAAEAGRAKRSEESSATAAGSPFKEELRAKKQAEDEARAAEQARINRASGRKFDAARLRDIRGRGLKTPAGKGGKPVTPDDLKRGDQVVRSGPYGPEPGIMTSVAKQEREFATGGVVKRGEKYHPIRDIPRDKLNAIRGRVAARAEKRSQQGEAGGKPADAATATSPSAAAPAARAPSDSTPAAPAVARPSPVAPAAPHPSNAKGMSASAFDPHGLARERAKINAGVGAVRSASTSASDTRPFAIGTHDDPGVYREGAKLNVTGTRTINNPVTGKGSVTVPTGTVTIGGRTSPIGEQQAMHLAGKLKRAEGESAAQTTPASNQAAPAPAVAPGRGTPNRLATAGRIRDVRNRVAKGLGGDLTRGSSPDKIRDFGKDASESAKADKGKRFQSGDTNAYGDAPTKVSMSRIHASAARQALAKAGQEARYGGKPQESTPVAPVATPDLKAQVAAKHADRSPGRLEDARENLKFREREMRDKAIKQAGGVRTDRRGTPERLKGAEGVKALHEKRLGMERAKAQLVEQGPRAESRARAKLPLFGGQTPEERPHVPGEGGASATAPATPRTSPVPGLPKAPHEMTNHELQHHYDSSPEFAKAWDSRYAGSPVNPLYHRLYLQEAAHHGAKVPDSLLGGEQGNAPTPAQSPSLRSQAEVHRASVGNPQARAARAAELKAKHNLDIRDPLSETSRRADAAASVRAVARTKAKRAATIQRKKDEATRLERYLEEDAKHREKNRRFLESQRAKSGSDYNPPPADVIESMMGRRQSPAAATTAQPPAEPAAPARPSPRPKPSREERLQSLLGRSQARGKTFSDASKGDARDDFATRSRGFEAFKRATVEARRSNRLEEALRVAKGSTPREQEIKAIANAPAPRQAPPVAMNDPMFATARPKFKVGKPAPVQAKAKKAAQPPRLPLTDRQKTANAIREARAKTRASKYGGNLHGVRVTDNANVQVKPEVKASLDKINSRRAERGEKKDIAAQEKRAAARTGADTRRFGKELSGPERAARLSAAGSVRVKRSAGGDYEGKRVSQVPASEKLGRAREIVGKRKAAANSPASGAPGRPSSSTHAKMQGALNSIYRGEPDDRGLMIGQVARKAGVDESSAASYVHGLVSKGIGSYDYYSDADAKHNEQYGTVHRDPRNNKPISAFRIEKHRRMDEMGEGGKANGPAPESQPAVQPATQPTPAPAALPQLKGSDKQIEWANRVREGHLNEIGRSIAAIEKERADEGEPLDEYDRRKIRRLKVAEHMLRTIPDAGFIIDHRHHHESVLPTQSPATFERWAKAAGV